MRGHIKLCLITAWLTAALLVLLMGTNLCVSTDEACLAAGETMFLLMLLLSISVGNESSNISKNMVSPAAKQASSVETHRFVPISRTKRAAVSQAVIKQSLMCPLISETLVSELQS